MERISERIRLKLASTVLNREVSSAEVVGTQVVDGEGEAIIKLHLNDEPNEKCHICEQKTLAIAAPPDKLYEITDIEVAEILIDNGAAEVSINVYYNDNFNADI